MSGPDRTDRILTAATFALLGLFVGVVLWAIVTTDRDDDTEWTPAVVWDICTHDVVDSCHLTIEVTP